MIRVPSEVVKQRAQVSASSKTLQIFLTILSEEVRLPLGPVSSSSAEGDGLLEHRGLTAQASGTFG